MSARGSIPWTTVEVQTFLGIIGEEEVQRELDGSVRNEKVFQLVSQRMAAEGFQRTSEQCRTKCKKLRSDYRKIKDLNSRSGVSRKTWKWFDMMDAIYRHRPASVGREGGTDRATSPLEADGQKPPPSHSSQGVNGDTCTPPETFGATKKRPLPAAFKDSSASEGEKRLFRREQELIESLRRAQREEARALEYQRELLEKLRAANTREAAAERERIEFLRKTQLEEAKDLSRQKEELQKEKAELQKKWEELRQEREELCCKCFVTNLKM